MKYFVGFMLGTLFWATILYTIKIPECIIVQLPIENSIEKETLKPMT